MKRLLMLIPLALLCCLGCQQGERVLVEPKADVEADIQAIKDIVAELQAANNISDVDTVMSYYADNSVVIPTNEPAVIGKDAIRDWSQQFYDSFTPKEVYVVDTVEISGRLAVARVPWSGVFTPKDGGEQRKSNGNMLWIFKRQSDESWKIAYLIWSNETLVRQTSTE